MCKSPEVSALSGASGATSELGDDDCPSDKLGRLCIVGRPPRTYRSSMGDHTTPFITHIDQLRDATEGKTLEEAVKGLNALFEHAQKLPGSGYHWTEPGIQKSWEEAKGRCEQALSNTTSLSDLQEAVGLYLEYRELIPLSTINIAAKSPALAGKGKGESYKNELEGIDLAAIAHLVNEADANIKADMAPYKKIAPFGLEQDGLEKDFLKQHAMSALGPTAGEDDISQMVNSLSAELEEEKKSGIVNELKHYLERTHNISKNTLPDVWNEIGRAQNEFESRVRQRYILNFVSDMVEQLKDKPTKEQLEQATKEIKIKAVTPNENPRKAPDAKEPNEKIDAVLQAASVKKTDLQQLITRCEGLLKGSTGKETDSLLSWYDAFTKPDDGDGDGDEASEEVVTAEDDTAKSTKDAKDKKANGIAVQVHLKEADESCPFAVQIVVDDDNKITDIKYGGRPKSPHPGTMGAHQIAWTVICDWVTNRLKGTSMGELETAVKQIAELPNKLANALRTEANALRTEAEDDGLEAEDDASKAEDGASEAEDHESEVDQTVAQLKAAKSPLQVLQEYIATLMDQANKVPGVTVLRGSLNGGKNEGAHRKILFHAELHTTEKINEAAIGLLDLNDWRKRDGPLAFVYSAYKLTAPPDRGLDAAQTGVKRKHAEIEPEDAAQEPVVGESERGTEDAAMETS